MHKKFSQTQENMPKTNKLPKSCVKPANQSTTHQIEKVFSSFMRNVHQTVSERTVGGL